MFFPRRRVTTFINSYYGFRFIRFLAISTRPTPRWLDPLRKANNCSRGGGRVHVIIHFILLLLLLLRIYFNITIFIVTGVNQPGARILLLSYILTGSPVSPIWPLVPGLPGGPGSSSGMLPGANNVVRLQLHTPGGPLGPDTPDLTSWNNACGIV